MDFQYRTGLVQLNYIKIIILIFERQSLMKLIKIKKKCFGLIIMFI